MIESPKDPLNEARRAEKTFRLTFEIDTERRWQTESANYRSAVDRAVWDMRQAGVSVSKIAQSYGTKDRGTIYDIISRMEAFVSVGTPEATAWLKVEPNVKARADGYPSAWIATVQAWNDFTRPDALSALEKTDSDTYSGWLAFSIRPDGRISIIEAEHPGSPLHKEVIAWQEDSPLVQQIKTQMEDEK